MRILEKMMKRGQQLSLSGMATIAIIFVVVAVVISVGAQLLGNIRDDLTAASAERNATVDGIQGLTNMSTRLPLLATVAVLGIVIVVLLSVFRAFSPR